MIQFNLLHSKYHLCSAVTRCLILSTYMKFVNLFPEIKQHIQHVRMDEREKEMSMCCRSCYMTQTMICHSLQISIVQKFDCDVTNNIAI
jgi:hypothetical protein